MEYIRASREVRHALVFSDPQPVSVGSVWIAAGQAANLDIFLILLGGFLYFGRQILLPTLIAAVVALTLAPLLKAGKGLGISPWVSAILIVTVAIGILALAAIQSAPGAAGTGLLDVAVGADRGFPRDAAAVDHRAGGLQPFVSARRG